MLSTPGWFVTLASVLIGAFGCGSIGIGKPTPFGATIEKACLSRVSVRGVSDLAFAEQMCHDSCLARRGASPAETAFCDARIARYCQQATVTDSMIGRAQCRTYFGDAIPAVPETPITRLCTVEGLTAQNSSTLTWKDSVWMECRDVVERQGADLHAFSVAPGYKVAASSALACEQLRAWLTARSRPARQFGECLSIGIDPASPRPRDSA